MDVFSTHSCLSSTVLSFPSLNNRRISRLRPAQYQKSKFSLNFHFLKRLLPKGDKSGLEGAQFSQFCVFHAFGRPEMSFSRPILRFRYLIVPFAVWQGAPSLIWSNYGHFMEKTYLLEIKWFLKVIGVSSSQFFEKWHQNFLLISVLIDCTLNNDLNRSVANSNGCPYHNTRAFLWFLF